MTGVVFDNSGHDGRVMKVPLDGGIPTTLASGQSRVSAIAIDATSVYWTTFDGIVNSTVMKVPLGGGRGDAGNR